jgi:nicotinamidase-related amidase
VLTFLWLGKFDLGGTNSGAECKQIVEDTMPIDFQGSYIDRAALVIMHYQVDVFAILFGEQPSPSLDRCNALIRQWRATGRPVLFPNFSLGKEYEHAPPASNRQISPYAQSGYFCTGLPVAGLAVEQGDLFYACRRASVFYGTSLDADLRTRGVSTLVMAGISTTGVVLSSVAWACDADYDVRMVQDCCYDPDQDAHEALFRSGFGGRAQIV